MSPLTMDWEFRRAINSVRLMTEVATEHGMTTEACLDGTGIEEHDLLDPSSEVTGRQELKLASNLARGLSHLPSIGLEIGSRHNLTTFGIWGLAVMSSQSMADAIAVGERYIRLTYSYLRPRFHVAEGRMLLRLDETAVPEPPRQFFVDKALAVTHRLCSQLLAEPAPVVGIKLVSAEPHDVDRYEKYLGVRPIFEADRTEMELDGSVLSRPLPQADALTARISEMQCEEILAAREAREGAAGRVRHVLLRQLGQAPNMDRVAKELATTSRSLRRRLNEEGVSFRVLVAEVQETLAEQFLISAGMSVEEASERLGFANTAAFTSAFKRWKGVSPGRWRSQQPPLFATADRGNPPTFGRNS